MTIILGLAAALGWGAGDFFGGTSVRRTPVFVVLAVSQLIGMILLAPVLLARGVSPPGNPRLLYACLAGLGVTVELRLTYVAIGRGQASLTAPVGALGASLAVIVGLIGGDPLSSTLVIGMMCALLGGGLTAWTAGGPTGEGDRGALLANAGLCLGAALGVGVMLASLHAAGSVDPYWATALVGLSTLISAALAAIIGQRRSLGACLPDRSQLKGLTLAAAVGVGGDLAYAAASRGGALSIVSALSALYPLATVSLGATLGGRRPGPLQSAGIGLALLGAVLLGAVAH